MCKKGYKKSGMWADKNAVLVSGCDATHWSKAKALQTLKKTQKLENILKHPNQTSNLNIKTHNLFDWWAVRDGGLMDG